MKEKEMPTIASPSRARLIILVVCILTPLLAFFVLWWRYSHPDFDKYNAALEAIRAHHITSDDWGRVDCSKQFPGLCPQDMALVTYLDDGNFRAVFPTYRDKDATLAGLMYTSRPLVEDDTKPRPSAIRFDERIIQVGSYGGLLLEKKLNDHWYKVSYKIH
jgi:hypothetical protein